MRRKFNLRRSTCFMIGAVGAVMNLLTGILMIAGVGPAMYAQTAAFVFFGGMILLLAVTEKGPDNKTRRLKLLLIFILGILGLLRLPLLDLAEVFVLPLVAVMYLQSRDWPWVLGLFVAEVGYGVVRTLALVPEFVGGNALLAEGIAVIVVGLVRGAAILRMRTASLPARPSA